MNRNKVFTNLEPESQRSWLKLKAFLILEAKGQNRVHSGKAL